MADFPLGLIVMGADYSYFAGSRPSPELARQAMLALRQGRMEEFHELCNSGSLHWIGNKLPGGNRCKDVNWATRVDWAPGALPQDIEECIKREA